MQAINQALLDMTNNSPYFIAFHGDDRALLTKFLNSTMERPRLDRSIEFNVKVLNAVSASDAAKFLEEVYKKEYDETIV